MRLSPKIQYKHGTCIHRNTKIAKIDAPKKCRTRMFAETRKFRDVRGVLAIMQILAFLEANLKTRADWKRTSAGLSSVWKRLDGKISFFRNSGERFDVPSAPFQRHAIDFHASRNSPSLDGRGDCSATRRTLPGNVVNVT